MKKLTKPTLALAASALVFYQACSEEDVEPARSFSDAGAATTDGSTSSGFDAGGNVGVDSGTTGTDATTPPPPPPKDAGKDGAKDAKSDAPTDGAIDAPTDAPPADTGTGIDAALVADCTAFCSCMATNCPGSLADAGVATCQTACETQTTWDLACRTTHCGLAVSDPVTHCPHGAGQAVCQ